MLRVKNRAPAIVARRRLQDLSARYGALNARPCGHVRFWPIASGATLCDRARRVSELHTGTNTSDVVTSAASYAEAIARNHTFVDDNKRTALGAAYAFLDRCGVQLLLEHDDELTAVMKGLAQGAVSRDDLTEHLRTHSRERVAEERTPVQAQARTIAVGPGSTIHDRYPGLTLDPDDGLDPDLDRGR